MSNYISADDFLTGILGTSEDYVVPTVGTVRIRPLTMAEARALSQKYGGDTFGLTIGAIVAGLEQPRLTEEQVAQLERGAAGPMSELAQRIMALSGMITDKAIEEKLGN